MDKNEALEPENREQAEQVKSPVQEEPSEKNQSWRSSLLNYAYDLVRLLAVIVLISILLLRVVVVSGPSMYRTLYDGDYLLVLSNLFYRQPQQGDIVIISKERLDDGAPIVKRIIATEGQKVDIDFGLGIVYVDGVALDEPYTHTSTTLQEGMIFPLTVEEGCVFVLGDNRNSSKDSRNPQIGQIDQREILGKVLFLFFPGTHMNTQDRDFGRIGVVK